MREDEILIRAREAAIAAGYTNLAGQPEGNAEADAAVRAGERDRNWSIIVAVAALRDLDKPLSEIQPADPDLAEARKLAATRGDDADALILGGSWDDLAHVPLILAAIKRGRELERGSPA